MDISNNAEVFKFETCAEVPDFGGRGNYADGSGGLVEVEGKVVWGGGKKGGVYWIDKKKQWKILIDDVELGATLLGCDGKLVAVGGLKGEVYSKKVMAWSGGRWSPISDMLLGCRMSCVVSIGGGSLVVMGGWGDGRKLLNAVQVFDGKAQTWHFGPPLPKRCWALSAVLHGDLVFVMGGGGLDRAVWCANVNDLITKQQSAWREIPDVPYHCSSVCVVDGVLLAIGGNRREEGSKKTSAICALHPVDKKWQHVGDMPFECSSVDTLLLSEGRLLVVDGGSKRVWRVTVEGLAKVFTKSRSLCEEAMTKGYIETSVTKCLILGAAGVGKTHFKHLLLKKDPPEQRVSTGLAEAPIRTMAFVGGKKEDDWFVVEDDQALMSVIGGTIKCGVSMAPSLADVVSTLPKITIDPSNVPSDGAVEDNWVEIDVNGKQEVISVIGGTVRKVGISKAPSLADVVSTLPKINPSKVSRDGAVGPISAVMGTTMESPIPEQSRIASIEDELVNHIHQSSNSKTLFGVRWIQFIDSGGQLQYHDILPLFIQSPLVTIFVLKLSEELSDRPTIEYYGADGKPVSKKYQSTLSHKEILQHCLGAIRSHDAHPLIITVGTHRDAKTWFNESIKKKNQQLRELLHPAHFRVLCNGKRDDLIFAVNGRSPENEDRCTAKELRKRIISESPQQSIKMPIAWFVLEVDLQRSSHDGVLSYGECQMVAKRYHVEGDMFSTALHYFVHHNVFLHYPEVLPQTVFCDSQVVLTKVTELVQYHHELRDNPGESVAVPGDLVMFRDHGLLSAELLRKFPKHYKEGLFTPQDLLKLLVSRGAIAMIRDGEYLMPALLPHLVSTQMSKYLQRGSTLMIRFPHGYIPSGLFCCLVALLLSSSWKVCMDGDQPLRLYRNCITLIQRGTPEIVTLVDMFSYIQIHIPEASSEVCREIRGCVCNVINSACSVLKYQDVQLEDAFLCAGARCTSDPQHVAVVVSRGSVYKWRCTNRGDQVGDLTKDQLMWLPDCPLGESVIPNQGPNVPTRKDLMNDVAAECPAKWRLVGIQLTVLEKDLDDIQSQVAGRPDPNLHAFELTLTKWSTLNPQKYTWSTIIGALEAQSVGENALAGRLRTKYMFSL